MMKMKIMLAASILCAMTTTRAGAADMTDNMGNMAGFPPISSINIPKDDNIVSAVWNGIVQEDAKSFFQKVKLPKNTDFTPLRKDGKFGLLTVTEEGNSVPAFVMNCEFAPVVGKEAMKDAFDAPRLSGKSVSELYGCNVALLGMENVLNGMFLEMAKRINEKPETDPKIPFNMLGVSFLNVEQIHRAQDRPRIYTSGVRAVFFIDGFAVPVYGKGYVMKYGDKYCLFSVLTMDSANEMVKKAADRIAAASVK